MPEITPEPLSEPKSVDSRLAFMFPGQGSQTVGMGKALVDNFPSAKAVFERADDALGESLSSTCFDGPAEVLQRTATTQPAILTTSIAALTVLREETGLEPTVALGHSLGELSALVCAGALQFEDAVRLVRLRGEAMQDAVPEGLGAMAAVLRLDPEVVERLCTQAAQGQVLSPANENGGGQIVVAGHAEAVERLSGMVKEHKGRAIPLKVSAPFHCALMQPAAERLDGALAELETSFGNLTIPVIANVTAEPYQDRARVRELLVAQVTSRVRWEGSVRKALHMGVTRAIEVGEGKVLGGLVKRIASEIGVKPFGSPDDLDVLKTGAW